MSPGIDVGNGANPRTILATSRRNEDTERRPKKEKMHDDIDRRPKIRDEAGSKPKTADDEYSADVRLCLSVYARLKNQTCIVCVCFCACAFPARAMRCSF